MQIYCDSAQPWAKLPERDQFCQNAAAATTLTGCGSGFWASWRHKRLDKVAAAEINLGRPRQGGFMRAMFYVAALAVLVSVAGCTEYPAAIHTTMAEAFPPYHVANDVDMDTAQGMTPVESATHNFGIRISPFQP